MKLANIVLENIKVYCAEHGFTIARFEKLCGIGNGVVASWGKGSAVTSLSLEKIAAYTKIPAERWIVEWEEK